MVEQGRQGIIGPVSYDEVCAGECCVRKRVRLYSRPGNDLTPRFPLIVNALARLRSRSSREGKHWAGRTTVLSRDPAIPSEVRVARMSRGAAEGTPPGDMRVYPPDIAARFAPSWHRIESNGAPLIRATRCIVIS